MNRWESDQWAEHERRERESERERANRSRSTPQLMAVTVYMTPDEYETIRKNASWDGKSVANYLVDHALGKTRRGC
jgi:hypothetical protein